MSSTVVSQRREGVTRLTVALVGNPNCGKTTLFNALTGMRQKVGNYAGVTVEKKEGRASLPDGGQARLLDLPGLYSLTPHSPDEVIAREVLMGLRPDTPRPDLILNVVDASNLERNLYLTSQLLDIGLPVVIVLTMADMLDKEGRELDADVLQKQIGVPVVTVVASRKQGLPALMEAIAQATGQPTFEPAWKIPEAIRDAVTQIQDRLEQEQSLSRRFAFAEAVTLLMSDTELPSIEPISDVMRAKIRDTHTRMLDEGVDFAALVIDARYSWIAEVSRGVLSENAIEEVRRPISTNERVDRVVMHPFWGYALFVLVMTAVFQAIFYMGAGPGAWIKDRIGNLGDIVAAHFPKGDLLDLFNAGVLGGVGTTLAFLPQILLLFFFISLLEDTGYMARAAFLMDRLMSKVGLHGKSFIPLLSSFACAIPGVMATRTIGDRKARLITILVAPLMSCSARLPVYILMASAFIPRTPVVRLFGVTFLDLQGVTFVSMYFLGMVAAFCVAWLFHKTLLKGVAPSFLMELPPYRLPSLRTAMIQMFERAWLFIQRAGTIILAVAVVVWFLGSYPKLPDLDQKNPEQRREQLNHSYLARIGHVIEPAIRPLGFDWKIGVGIASSFVAREVFVSTMETDYGVEERVESKSNDAIVHSMRADRNPDTGKPVFTPLVAVCLMIYYVLAMQCMSTVAVVRRETNGWKWALFQLGYMTLLAWGVTYVVYHVGLWLHLG